MALKKVLYRGALQLLTIAPSRQGHREIWCFGGNCHNSTCISLAERRKKKEGVITNLKCELVLEEHTLWILSLTVNETNLKREWVSEQHTLWILSLTVKETLLFGSGVSSGHGKYIEKRGSCLVNSNTWYWLLKKKKHTHHRLHKIVVRKFFFMNFAPNKGLKAILGKGLQELFLFKCSMKNNLGWWWYELIFLVKQSRAQFHIAA